MPIILPATDASLTLAELRTRVLGNSFGAGRYATTVDAELNDAVTEVCRRLDLHRSSDILDYDAAGLVTPPSPPFFRVEAVWLAAPDAVGSGDAAIARYAQRQLEPLPVAGPAGLGVGEPRYYVARRAPGADAYPQVQIQVFPVGTAGLVAVQGLARPPRMAGDTDTSGLGGDFDRALVAYAKARCFDIEDDFEAAAVWDARFAAAIVSLGAADLDDGPHVTPGLEDDGYTPNAGR